MNKITARRATAGLALLAPTLTALAADVKAGAWDLSVGGFVNAYNTHSSCSGHQAFTGSGLALASQALGCGGNEKSTVIGNGLLPNALTVGAKTQQNGWDVGANLMIGAAVSSADSISNSDGFTMSGAELGGSASLGDFGLLVNLQSGKGLGVLADGDSGDLKQTNLLLQGTWQATPALKLGASHGRSRIKEGAGSDLRDNTSLTGGAYYRLTDSVTLVGELSRTDSRTFAGDKARLKGLAFGAILFF